MSRDDAVLLDMLIAARRATEFAAGLTRDQLSSDLKTQSAILHQLLVLGEAAKRLSDTFREHIQRPRGRPSRACGIALFTGTTMWTLEKCGGPLRPTSRY